jgi:hypothetical protein
MLAANQGEARHMTRNVRQLLLVPAIAAAALLSGCVTYGYRGGQGDYYYGQPSTEYSYPYGYYDYGYPGYYGAPYWSGSFGYYGGYYGGPYRPPHHGGGHGNDHGHGGGNGHGNDGGNDHPQPHHDLPRPPWRNLDDIGRPDARARPAQRPPERPSPGQAGQRAPQSRPMQPRVERAAPMPPVPRATGNPKRDVRRNPVP